MTEFLTVYLPLICAALAAGAINALAGGGTLLTFPALTAALGDMVLANGTSTVALVPGSLASAWGYRRELKQVRSWAWLLLAPSLAGGLIGSRLVIRYPDHFADLVPWLILTATMLFFLQPLFARLTRSRHKPWPSWLLVIVQFITATYGGYFGAGIGIIMLAMLSFMNVGDIHQMNAIKTVQAVLINLVAAAMFIHGEKVHWPYALTMGAAAIVGGYLGAHFGRLLNRSLVRGIVIGIGTCLTIYYFSRSH